MVIKEREEMKKNEPDKDGNERKAVVRIDRAECERSRIGSITREVPFTDYSVDPPEEFVYLVTFNPIPMSERKALINRCTITNRAGIPEIDWEKLDDLMIARTIGLAEADWEEFKRKHPIGLYNKLALASKEVNCELALTKDQIEELKNLGGQGS